MRMTPLDVQSHVFRRRFSGFDPAEVESFLRMVAEDYEGLVREAEGQRDRILRLESRVEEMVANETLLKETLITAQSLSDELRRTAARESEVILGEAEVRAEKILDASHRRATQLAEDIREMRSLRTRLASSLRLAIENHVTMIDSLEQDAERPPETGTLSFLKPSAEKKKATPDRAGAVD
jgi:cell division initiation protein